MPIPPWFVFCSYSYRGKIEGEVWLASSALESYQVKQLEQRIQLSSPRVKKKRKKACVLEDRNGLNSVGLFPSAAMLLGVPESVASEVDSY